MPHGAPVTYKDGTVDVPHWGISLRTIFGTAVEHHDIAKKGRNVNLTINGVHIGTIQLRDKEKIHDNRQG